MALNYEVKKKVFGFDQTKTEKYVAQLKTLGIIQFGDLCDEVTKIGMAPRGVVKMVLDGLIDTLNININKGFSVQLGDFGCLRPGINAKSQGRGCEVGYGLSSENNFYAGTVLQGDADTCQRDESKLGKNGNCFGRRFCSGNRRKRGRRKSVGITFFQSAWNGKRK